MIWEKIKLRLYGYCINGYKVRGFSAGNGIVLSKTWENYLRHIVFLSRMVMDIRSTDYHRGKLIVDRMEVQKLTLRSKANGFCPKLTCTLPDCNKMYLLKIKISIKII